jgi:hypothetical protein
MREKITWGMKIASAARFGLSEDWAEKDPGYGALWVSQVLEHAGAIKPGHLQSPDAKLQFEAYKKWCYVVPRDIIWQPGDIVYKVGPRCGRHGEVGILITPCMVAENASCHFGSALDARGIRGMSSFGMPTHVLRWKQFLPPSL